MILPINNGIRFYQKCKRLNILLYLLIKIIILNSCNLNNSKNIMKSYFGSLPNGNKIYKYKLTNGYMAVEIISYGGIITNINVPNSKGKDTDIVLGFNTLDQYIDEHPYFGAIIGRYGNRIANGKFSLNGIDYQLAINNGKNSLHGGLIGFDKVSWSVKELNNDEDPGIKLTYFSKDMEEGYPGNLQIDVTYILTKENELKIFYEAITDASTIINLTNHSYFNLGGESSGDILDHFVSINANSYLPVDENLIPTGEIRNVKNTPFNFIEMKKIGLEIEIQNNQLIYGKGYDHCWVLNDYGEGIRKIAEANNLATGINMEVYSDQPGVQFYTGNFLDGSLKSKELKKYEKRSGFCLETQHFPDSPNQPSFPKVILDPDKKYETQTWYKFSTKTY